MQEELHFGYLFLFLEETMPATVFDIYDPRGINQAEIGQLRSREGMGNVIPLMYLSTLREYEEYERWYTGEALKEIIASPETGQSIEPYPLRINPLPSIIDKHVAAVIGIMNPGTRPLQHKAPYRSGMSENGRLRIDRIINRLLDSAGGASRLSDAVRMSNIYGGFVVRAKLVPDGNQLKPVWEYLNVKNVLIIPKANYQDIEEIWYVFYITRRQAEKLGAKLDEDEPVAVYVEHWTETEIEAFVNEQQITLPSGEKKGKNPYGFIPAVYIPHVRSSRFYGDSVVGILIGLIKELNYRFADYGDAIRHDAQRILAARNITGTKTRYILNGIQVVDIGSGVANVGGTLEPDLFEVSSRGLANQPMSDLVDRLWAMIGRLAYVPPISFGEDEGSQRSSLTLVTRFWPLISHADDERRHIEDGLRHLAVLTFKMLEAKRMLVPREWLPPAGWTEEDIGFVWSEQLPRDVETFVEMVVRRWQEGLGSPRTLLSLLPDVANPDEELENIKDWLLFLARLEQIKKGKTGSDEQTEGDDRKPTESSDVTQTNDGGSDG